MGNENTVLNTDDDLFDFEDDEEIDIDADGDEEETIEEVEDEDDEDSEDGEISLDDDEEDEDSEDGEEISLDDDEEDESSDELEGFGEDTSEESEDLEEEDNDFFGDSSESDNELEEDNSENQESLEDSESGEEGSGSDDFLNNMDLDGILDDLENEIGSMEQGSFGDEEEPSEEDEDTPSEEPDDNEEEQSEEDNTFSQSDEETPPANLVSEEDAENIYEDDEGKMFTRNGDRPIGYDSEYNLIYLDMDTNENGSEEQESEEEYDVLSGISSDSFGDSLGDDDDPEGEDGEEPDDDLDDSIIEPEANDFIDENGNLVVMNGGDVGDTFEIKVISYKNIAIAKRIRSGKSVEDLVQSVKSTGLLNPIMVAPLATKDMYVLIDGYRRILACARAGITEIPAVVNNKIKTTEIPIVEAMYNHKKPYTMQDTIDYIEYLEKEKGLTNPSLIEFLMDLDNGDYSKLKDILADDDEDIVTKLVAGQMTIAQAFKALEKRRSKESKEEKDVKKAAKVYGDGEESGANEIADIGETGDEESALTDEQLEELAINPTELDEGLDEQSLDTMVQESNETPGFEAHQQKVGEREYIDPVIKRTVLARDNFTCACCKRGGESYVDSLDYHHILPVFLGGKDTPENGVALCVLCHRLVHLFSTGDLHLPKEKTEEEIGEMEDEERIIYEDEQKKFKRIVKLGDVIRKGMAQKGINREQFKKEHSNAQIGRRKPGKNANQEEA